MLDVRQNVSSYVPHRRLTYARRSLAESALRQLLVHRGNYCWLFMCGRVQAKDLLAARTRSIKFKEDNAELFRRGAGIGAVKS